MRDQRNWAPGEKKLQLAPRSPAPANQRELWRRLHVLNLEESGLSRGAGWLGWRPRAGGWGRVSSRFCGLRSFPESYTNVCKMPVGAPQHHGATPRDLLVGPQRSSLRAALLLR